MAHTHVISRRNTGRLDMFKHQATEWLYGVYKIANRIGIDSLGIGIFGHQRCGTMIFKILNTLDKHTENNAKSCG